MQKNKNNYKAQFRKGKAQAELGYVEKAEATLTELLTKNASGELTPPFCGETSSLASRPFRRWDAHNICKDAVAINAELARIRAADKEREKKHNQKFKGEVYFSACFVCETGY